MQLIGADIAQSLAEGNRTTAKIVFNGAGVIFFPANEQHRDQRAPGISYDDNYTGNALAATLHDRQIEVRYHQAFSESQVVNLISALVQRLNLKFLRDWRITYQGREIVWPS